MRSAQALLLVAVLAVTGWSMTGFSSATFTAASSSTGSVTSAADWTPPSVTVQNPGTSVRGTATVTATATDGESGVADVVLQYQPASGGSWITLCTDTTSPYSCSWNTTTVTDGTYDLRAIATDGAGYSTTSDQVRTVVANSLLVVLTSPGDVVRGSVPLTTTTYSGGLAVSTARVEYAPAGTTTWKTACTNLSASSTSTCTWDTTAVTSDYYDLRSVVTLVGGGTYISAVVADVLVDNAAPVVTMTDPGTPLSGTRTFAATATDAHSGVAQVVIQYATSGSTTYRTLCTIAGPPFSCRYDTTALAAGSYSFRAVATDVAGNATTSAPVTNRVVDNTVSSISVEDPGAYLTGTVTLTAIANASSGVTSVRIQRAPAGTTTWSDICTDTTAPFTCSWNTTTVADGSYDLRAVLLDGAARTTTSAVVASRIVDNSPVRGVDVQARNNGGTVGRLDSGDTLTYTYSEQVNPASVLAGWNGAATPVSLRLRDGNALGLGNRGDAVDVLKGTAAVNLGSVVLNQDFMKTGKSAVFNGTMTASTVTVGGVVRSVIVVQLGAQASGGGLRNVTTAAAMTWTPASGATDLNGNKCSTAPVTETGTADRDF
ncbi:MAG: fibronectin [Aeromicrobium sp.]|nr:fibronectin [Aeromicrobium sp.]